MIRAHTFSASVPPSVSVAASIATENPLWSDAQRYSTEAENLSTFPVNVDASAWSADGTAYSGSILAYIAALPARSCQYRGEELSLLCRTESTLLLALSNAKRSAGSAFATFSTCPWGSLRSPLARCDPVNILRLFAGSLAPPQAASAQDTAPASIHHQRHTTTQRWPRFSGLSYGPPCGSSPRWCAVAPDAGAPTRCRWSTP